MELKERQRVICAVKSLVRDIGAPYPAGVHARGPVRLYLHARRTSARGKPVCVFPADGNTTLLDDGPSSSLVSGYMSRYNGHEKKCTGLQYIPDFPHNRSDTMRNLKFRSLWEYLALKTREK